MFYATNSCVCVCVCFFKCDESCIIIDGNNRRRLRRVYANRASRVKTGATCLLIFLFFIIYTYYIILVVEIKLL